MKINYDPKVQAIYIELSKGRYEISRELSELVILDEDKKGKILGIEILNVPKILVSKLKKRQNISSQAAVAHKIR